MQRSYVARVAFNSPQPTVHSGSSEVLTELIDTLLSREASFHSVLHSATGRTERRPAKLVDKRTEAASATTSAIAYQIAASLFRAALKESYQGKQGRIRRLFRQQVASNAACPRA